LRRIADGFRDLSRSCARGAVRFRPDGITASTPRPATEVDGASVPCRDGGGAEEAEGAGAAGRGGGGGGRILLAGAVELSEDGAPRRIRLEAVESYASEALRGLISGAAAPGARVVTDGWSGYAGLPDSPRGERAVGGYGALT